MSYREQQESGIQTPVAEPVARKPVLTRRTFVLGGFWSLLFLASLLALAVACGGDGEPPAGPRLVMEGESFDVGAITIGEAVERTIAFSNKGEEPLTVSIVKVRPAPDADCGCGVEGFEVRPEEVQPGEAGELVFTLKALEGMENTQDVMLVELESNDLSNPQRTITLIFNMVPSAGQEG